MPFTTLVQFDGSNGSNPRPLAIDAAGNVIGATVGGGPNDDGVVFEIAKTNDGYATAPTILAAFDGNNGEDPYTTLIYVDGNVIGETTGGGQYGYGTLFEIAKTSSGYAAAPTTLVDFDDSDGASPWGLVADSNGDLLGTAVTGGPGQFGSVFELAKTSAGYASAPTTLATFTQDFEQPGISVVADAAGDLFGTVSEEVNGVSGGAVFEIARTTSGGYAATPTEVSTIPGDGNTNLIIDSAGNLFGETVDGGAFGAGAVFEIAKTSEGYPSAAATLINFDRYDGTYPIGGLLEDAAGDLFGVTAGAKPYNDGTIFEIRFENGSYADSPTTLYAFGTSGRIGNEPFAGLVVDAQGDLLGTTELGATDNKGTVFELSNSGYEVADGAGFKEGLSFADGSSGFLRFNSENVLTEKDRNGLTGKSVKSYVELYDPSGAATSLTEYAGDDATGDIIAVENYASDGTTLANALFENVTGKPFQSYRVVYNGSGQHVSTIQYSTTDGSGGPGSIIATLNYDPATHQLTSEIKGDGETLTWSRLSDGAYGIADADIPGANYSTRTNVYNASGALMAKDYEFASGLREILGSANALGFDVSSAGATISLASGEDVFSFTLSATQTAMTASGSSERFEFGSGFGKATITDFSGATGGQGDVLDFDAGMFTNISSFSQLLSSSYVTQSNHAGVFNTIISDNFGDKLTLAGVSLSMLSASDGNIA